MSATAMPPAMLAGSLMLPSMTIRPSNVPMSPNAGADLPS
jgi:hypothetical protein